MRQKDTENYKQDFKHKVIIALDFDNMQRVRNIIRELEGEAYFYKIGMELFTSCGPEVVREIKNSGYGVFLDLKFLDIPNTVYKAVRSAAGLGADIISVHALGGIEMMNAAKKAVDEHRKESGKKISLFAVTILTSMSSDGLKEIGFCDKPDGKNSGKKNISRNIAGNNGNYYNYNNKDKIDNSKIMVERAVLKLAGLAKMCGFDGVVCSPVESAAIKYTYGNEFQTITPGIRLRDSGKEISGNDQKRISSPSAAFAAKADYIVIGRPITRSADPLLSLKNVYEDIKNAIKL